MDDSRAEFVEQDLADLEQARRETEAAEAAALAEQAGATGEETAAPAAEPTPPAPAAPAPGPAPAPNPAEAPAAPAQAPAAPAPAPAPADAQGSVKAALRAARHAERQLREENAALRRRIEEGGIPDPKAPDEPDESQLNDVREYAPEVAKKLDKLSAENAELRRRAGTAEPAAPAFQPEQFDPDVQAAIDEVPELLLWHSSAEHQDLYQAAKAADALLQRSPLWDGKPLAERFAAAVDLVKAQVATPSKASPQKTLEDAQRVIAASASAPAGALTVGDLRGGQSPASHSYRDPHDMVKNGMSDEEILASLPEMP